MSWNHARPERCAQDDSCKVAVWTRLKFSGHQNQVNYIHKLIMIFIIDLTIKAEEKVLRL